MIYDLTKVHRANLWILKEIDRICRKYKIQYLLDAGTLLGAVRHEGFIPWDDDADVAFTRKNFDTFLKAAKNELPDGLELLMPEEVGGGRAFYDFTPRILYLNSQTHNQDSRTDYYGGKLNHLWVDLFIIDEISDKPLQRAWTLFQMKTVYGFAMGHRYDLDYSKYSLTNKLFVVLLANIGKLLSMKTIHKWQSKIALKYQKGIYSSRYYSNYDPNFLYVTLKKEWCENTVSMKFCDTMLMCPAGWKEVLTQVYGDYEKLPPIEQQIPAHSNMEEDGFYVQDRIEE